MLAYERKYLVLACVGLALAVSGLIAIVLPGGTVGVDTSGLAVSLMGCGLSLRALVLARRLLGGQRTQLSQHPPSAN